MPSTSRVRGWTPGDHGRRMRRARLPGDHLPGMSRVFASSPFSIATGSIINQRFAGERDARPREDRKRRRVGKECRSRWSPYHEKKKMQLKLLTILIIKKSEFMIEFSK